ncbi:MAG: tetratricopeptide repeat protein [Solirubrobacteraceae bacterium]
MNEPADPRVLQVERATVLCDLHRFEEALAVLGDVLAADPDDPRAWCVCARAELGRGNREAALNAAKHAIALTPDAEWPHRLASIALSGLGKVDDAVWHAREAVRVDPHEWRALTNLAGRLAERAGDHDEAGDAAARALELAPHEVQTHMVAGAVARARGRRSEAEAAFRNALAIDPQHGPAHNELARLRLGRGPVSGPTRLAEAASGFATAVRTDPRLATSRGNLELVLRGFLSRVTYLVWLDAALITRLTTSGDGSTAAVLAVIALVLPAAFAWRFVVEASPAVRARLFELVQRDARVRAAVILELVALACLVGAAAAPAARTGFALGAALSALVSRLILLMDLDRHKRAVGGAVPRHSISTTTLWLLVVAFVGAAAALAYGSTNGLNVRESLIVAVVFATVAALLASVAVRRRTSR